MDNEAATIGFGMHMLVSTLIGMTFGAATTRINRLGITGHRKGVVGGIITGMIAFVVIFIPLNVLVLQPILARMMTLMNLMTTEQQVLTHAISEIRHNGWNGYPRSSGVWCCAWCGNNSALFCFKVKVKEREKRR